MDHIRRILVPMDGSPPSIAALAQATGLAADLGASVDVLHVSAPDELKVGSTTEAAASAREQAARELEAAIADATAQLGDKLTRRTEAGDPLRKILEVAAANDADLIVMGTHGRVGRLHTLVGSVAEGVVRSSPVPVMTVRRDGEGESFAERIHGRSSLAEQVRR